MIYLVGEGIPKDYEKAAYWFLQAALQGHAKAQTNLGSLYEHGFGLDRDYNRAYFWTLLAAAKGDALAEKNAQTIADLLSPQERAAIKGEASKWMSEHP